MYACITYLHYLKKKLLFASLNLLVIYQKDGSKKSRAICCFLTRNEIITENEEKVNIFDNISVLPTSIFIFDKFVDGAQPEVAGERRNRWSPAHFENPKYEY